MFRRAPLFAIMAAALSACQTHRPALTPLPESTGNQGVAAPRVNGTVSDVNAAAAPTVDIGTAPAIGRNGLPAGARAGEPVTLDFADSDIREIVKQVLGEILQLNYTIDPAVHGTATIQTRQPLPRADLLPTLETLLNQNGATLVQAGSLYRVVPSAVAAASPAFGNASTSGSQVFRLRYASARDLQKLLEPYVGEGAKVTADPSRNELLVTGEPAARETVIGLIRAFDVDLLAGQSYALFPVNSGDPGKDATELQKIFQTEGEGALAGLVRIVPMERVNAVLVVSSQPNYIEEARRLFRLIEQGKLETARSWHVYYVQNGSSNDLAYVLQRAFTPNNVTASPSESPGSTAPGLGQSGFNTSGTGSSSGSSGFSGSSGSTGGSSTGGLLGGLQSNSGGLQPQQGRTDAQGGGDNSAATESLSAGGSGESNVNVNSIRIIPNKTNNALLIYATPSEESTIESMLHKVDILPLQVRIDATIAEVTLTDNLNYGTQFSFGGSGVFGLLSNGASATTGLASSALTAARGALETTLATPAGFSVARVGRNGNAQFVLNALSDLTNVRVLSSPQIMVLDNQTARLQVGSLVPYLAQTSQSTITTGSPIINSVEYRETGVILEVIPRVSSGGLVTLDLSQEVSDVANDGTTQIPSPTFDERKVQSRIVVQDGQTVGIAGLIRDTVSRENAGVPILKDIPVLGSLLSNQNNTRTRTELLVLLTPHVIDDQRQARGLTEDLRQKLLDAALVPEQLPLLHPTGSANPNAKLTR